MSTPNEIDRLEARCVELYEHFQRADATAAAAERNEGSDAAALRRRVTAWHDDYTAAVRDLQRERAAGGNYVTNPSTHPSPKAIRDAKRAR